MAKKPFNNKEIKVDSSYNLSPSSFSRERVDIIVPFYGQYALVSRLVESIIYSCRTNPYLITLVDDGSPNEAFAKTMKKVPQVQTIRHEKRDGFAAALLDGFKHTEQPWVLFMHSDCKVTNGTWMLNLGRSLLSLHSQSVGLVSSLSDNPGDHGHPLLKSGKVREGDIVIDNDEFIPFYSSMCHRSLFDKVGGFLKSYPYFGYEDEEFAYRMKKKKLKQAICGRSWVHHDEAGTIGPMIKENPDIKLEIEKNRDRCIADMRLLK